MKEKTIQARLSEADYIATKQKAAECGMTLSEFLRSALLNTEVYQVGKQREIMREICIIFSVINQMDNTEEVECIRKGVNRICLYLK